MSSPTDTSTPNGGTAPSQAIIEAIARAEGVDVTDVEPPEYDPLYAVVDPEALDELFERSQPPEVARVVLEYEGYGVVVHADGRVDVCEDPSALDGSAARPIEE